MNPLWKRILNITMSSMVSSNKFGLIVLGVNLYIEEGDSKVEGKTKWDNVLTYID